MPASSSAQEEYDALFNKTNRIDRHPQDSLDSSSSPHRTPSPADHTNDRKTSSIRDRNPRSVPDDDNDNDNNDDDNDDTHNTKDANMRSRYFLPTTRFDANTGPKGVIADALNFENAKRSQARFSLFRSNTTSASRSSHLVAPAYSGAYGSASSGRNSATASDDEGGSSHEDSFMQRWRQSRLAEMEKGVMRSRTVSPSKRVWGGLEEVDPDGFLDAIEKVRQDTIVVVYVFDDASPTSSRVESHVRVLARQHPTTRFVKLHYQDAEMEGAGVPALIAYRGGEKFADLVPVQNEVSSDGEVTVSSLEAALKRQRILF